MAKIDHTDPLCCGQAMLVHGTGHSLDELGIAKLPRGTQLSFKELNQQLRSLRSTRLAKCFRLKTVPRDFSIFHMLSSQRGVYGVHCYHFNREDAEDIPSEYDVRKLFEEKGIEAITHFVVFNMWTGVVFLDPELEFVTLKDKQDTWGFLDRLRDEHALLFDTSDKSSSNIRIFSLEIVPAAFTSKYNTPACITDLIMSTRGAGEATRPPRPLPGAASRMAKRYRPALPVDPVAWKAARVADAEAAVWQPTLED